MKKVKAIVERVKDGSFSIYMDIDPNELSYFVSGTGKSLDDAKCDFLKGYEDMKAYYAEKNKQFEEVEFEFAIDVVSA